MLQTVATKVNDELMIAAAYKGMTMNETETADGENRLGADVAQRARD
ncbi:MAG: hypothetical protein AAGD07_00510 [Planctomycetota bacterium]